MKVRIRFTKVGKIRWTSHRDMARMWERALNRVQLPVAYSEGFSPRPKVSFGLALPTGGESLAEYLDVVLRPDTPVEVESLPPRLSAALPVGLDAVAAVELEGPADSLQQAVVACTWLLEVKGVSADEAAALCHEALAADELPVTRTRKGKEVHDDLRPAVLSLDVHHTTPDGAVLLAELATQPRGVRPSELLAALRPDLSGGTVRRTHQWIAHDGARVEPVPWTGADPVTLWSEPPTADLPGGHLLDAGAPHAEVRAS